MVLLKRMIWGDDAVAHAYTLYIVEDRKRKYLYCWDRVNRHGLKIGREPYVNDQVGSDVVGVFVEVH
jgi:hypothetical protein